MQVFIGKCGNHQSVPYIVQATRLLHGERREREREREKEKEREREREKEKEKEKERERASQGGLELLHRLRRAPAKPCQEDRELGAKGAPGADDAEEGLRRLPAAAD